MPVQSAVQLTNERLIRPLKRAGLTAGRRDCMAHLVSTVNLPSVTALQPSWPLTAVTPDESE